MQHRRRDRRRPAAEAGAGLRHPGLVHARLLRAAPALVRDRAEVRHRRGLQHLRGERAAVIAPSCRERGERLSGRHVTAVLTLHHVMAGPTLAGSGGDASGQGTAWKQPMPGIDESRAFIPLKIAVLTVSDTRSLEEDKSGATLAERIGKAGHAVAARAIVTDDVEKIRAQVKAWIADPAIDVVITHRRHRLHRPRRDAGSARAAVREAHGRLRHAVPAGEPRQDRHLGDPDARDRGRRGRDLHLLPARLARRLPRCLGRDPRAPARLPLPPLQLRRDHAAARRAFAQGESPSPTSTRTLVAAVRAPIAAYDLGQTARRAA